MAGQTRATYVAPYGSDGPGTGLQTLLNPLVTTTVGGDPWSPGVSNGGSPPDYVNGTVQNGQSPLFSLWNLAGGGNSSATMILQVAGNAPENSFGLYNPSNPNDLVQLFGGGTAAGAIEYVKFVGGHLNTSINGSTWVDQGNFPTTFGMYLNGPGNGYTPFYSQSSLNGGDQHVVAYQGYAGRTITIAGSPVAWDANSYVLGWEDLPFASSDLDYQDMVLLVSEITPVPEPTTMIAGALLLLPFGASTLRILRRKA